MFIALIRLRFSDPYTPRPYRIPLNLPWKRSDGSTVAIPILGFVGLLGVSIIFFEVVATHRIGRIAGPAWVGIGLLLYLIYRIVKKRPVFGSIVSYLQGPTNGKVYAVLQQTSGGTTALASSIPIPTTLSEALTSASSSAQRPLSLDGLEQSVDASRGTRWMLLLNEVGGAAGLVNIRLYEAGNRSRPIANTDMSVAANQQLKLDTIFAALGLDAFDRRKDRTNVEVVVTATGGSARVAASAVSIDNQTGDTKVYALAPVVGSGNPNIDFAAPVINSQPPPTQRRRGVHH